MALRLFTCIAALSCAVVAHAQPEAAPRVVRTLGDPGQVVCVESEGAALWARYLDVWVKWNHVRTVAGLGALACFIQALR